MDPSQGTKERKRWGNREDRKEREMDHLELGKRGDVKDWGVEDKRVGGHMERNQWDECERLMKWIHGEITKKKRNIKDSDEDAKEKDISWCLKVMNRSESSVQALTSAAVAIVAQVGKLPWQPHLLAVNHLPRSNWHAVPTNTASHYVAWCLDAS